MCQEIDEGVHKADLVGGCELPSKHVQVSLVHNSLVCTPGCWPALAGA